jgi:hypothetical protein
LLLALPTGALGQTLVTSSNPVNGVGVPTHGIYCMDGGGNALPCAFSGGGSSGAIKPASTGATTADASQVVALSPNSPLPPGTNTIGAAKITDGTNIGAVKAASTAAVAADPAQVVAMSPNSPLPPGTNTIGAAKITDGTNIGAVKAAGTAAVAADPAQVVALSPNTPMPPPNQNTPVACTTTTITTGGTAVTLITGPIKGGWVKNPTTASGEGIATAENAYINLVGTASTTEGGATTALEPGLPFQLPALASGVTVSVVAATASHKLSCTVW